MKEHRDNAHTEFPPIYLQKLQSGAPYGITDQEHGARTDRPSHPRGAILCCFATFQEADFGCVVAGFVKRISAQIDNRQTQVKWVLGKSFRYPWGGFRVRRITCPFECDSEFIEIVLRCPRRHSCLYFDGYVTVTAAESMVNTCREKSIRIRTRRLSLDIEYSPAPVLKNQVIMANASHALAHHR